MSQNASHRRFNDGGCSVLGAEIGIFYPISFHARGAHAGAGKLTSYKYNVRGNGHLRSEVFYVRRVTESKNQVENLLKAMESANWTRTRREKTMPVGRGVLPSRTIPTRKTAGLTRANSAAAFERGPTIPGTAHGPTPAENPLLTGVYERPDHRLRFQNAPQRVGKDQMRAIAVAAESIAEKFRGASKSSGGYCERCWR